MGYKNIRKKLKFFGQKLDKSILGEYSKGQKAQGIMEYALILAFVVIVAAALVTNRESITSGISGVADSVAAFFGGE